MEKSPEAVIIDIGGAIDLISMAYQVLPWVQAATVAFRGLAL